MTDQPELPVDFSADPQNTQENYATDPTMLTHNTSFFPSSIAGATGSIDPNTAFLNQSFAFPLQLSQPLETPRTHSQNAEVHPTLAQEERIVNELERIQQQHQLATAAANASTTTDLNSKLSPTYPITTTTSLTQGPIPSQTVETVKNTAAPTFSIAMDPVQFNQALNQKIQIPGVSVDGLKQQTAQAVMSPNLLAHTVGPSSTPASAIFPVFFQQDGRLFMAPQMAAQSPMMQPQVVASPAPIQPNVGASDSLGLGGAVTQNSGSSSGAELPLPSPHSLFHRDGSRRMRGGVIEPFPEKLHRLLLEVEAAGRGDVISFVASGRAFCIHKPDQFFKEIVPLYFRQSRLSSFKRQLNLYGFELINTGPARGGYFHELFVKDQPELCRRMRRIAVKVVKGKDGNRGVEQQDEEQKPMGPTSKELVASDTE